MDNFEIFKIVIGQVMRHFLSIAAGFLASYGVTEAMQDQLVEASVAIGIAVVVFGASMLWAYVSKWLAINGDPPLQDK